MICNLGFVIFSFMINFLKYKNIYFAFSGILIILSLIAIGLWGLNLGIDFEGGSILEVKFTNEISIKEVRTILNTEEIREKIPEITIQKIDKRAGEIGVGFLIRMGEGKEMTSTEQKTLVLSSLKELGEVEEKRFGSVSGVVGEEIKNSMIIVIILSIILVISYIGFAFRKVSKPVSSWYYGIASFIALFHDILIILGVLAILGHLYGVTITIPIITGLLIICGYSINDSVVVFDRIRENLSNSSDSRSSIEKKYENIVNQSLNETIVRSINTSLSTLLAIIIIFFIGGITLRYLILTLMIGIVIGTYSSIFLASPMLATLVVWLNRRLKT